MDWHIEHFLRNPWFADPIVHGAFIYDSEVIHLRFCLN